jgi:membrane protease YdiL (CAAX protease family)
MFGYPNALSFLLSANGVGPTVASRVQWGWYWTHPDEKFCESPTGITMHLDQLDITGGFVTEACPLWRYGRVRKSPEVLRNVLYNRTERRLRTLWRLLIGIALALLTLGTLRAFALYILAFLLMLTAQIPFDAVGNAQQMSQGLNQAYESFPLIAGIRSLIVLLLVGLAILLLARWIDRRPWRDFGFHFKAAWWRDLGFGLLLGMVLMGIVFGLEFLFGWNSVHGVIENGQPELPFWQLVVNGLLAYVLVGVEEEWFFRGFLIKNLAEGLHLRRISSRSAVLVSYLFISLFFGFAHGSNANATMISSLNLGLIGLVLGLGFILTGELAIPIGLHIAWNFAQGYIFGFAVSGSDTQVSLLATGQTGPAGWTGGAFGPEGGGMGLVAALLGAVMIYAWVRWTRRRASLRSQLAQYSSQYQEAGTT